MPPPPNVCWLISFTFQRCVAHISPLLIPRSLEWGKSKCQNKSCEYYFRWRKKSENFSSIWRESDENKSFHITPPAINHFKLLNKNKIKSEICKAVDKSFKTFSLFRLFYVARPQLDKHFHINSANLLKKSLLFLSSTHAGQNRTMLGSVASSNDLGAIPCAISWLYKGINEKRQKSGARFSVRVSALGINATKPGSSAKDLLAALATGNYLNVEK